MEGGSRVRRRLEGPHTQGGGELIVSSAGAISHPQSLGRTAQREALPTAGQNALTLPQGSPRPQGARGPGGHRCRARKPCRARGGSCKAWG